MPHWGLTPQCGIPNIQIKIISKYFEWSMSSVVDIIEVCSYGLRDEFTILLSNKLSQT